MNIKVKAFGAFAGLAGAAALKVFTGVVTGIDPAPNHLSINFAPMNEERTNVIRDDKGAPIIWSVEMGGSAQMARQGISVNTFRSLN